MHIPKGFTPVTHTRTDRTIHGYRDEAEELNAAFAERSETDDLHVGYYDHKHDSPKETLFSDVHAPVRSRFHRETWDHTNETPYRDIITGRDADRFFRILDKETLSPSGEFSEMRLQQCIDSTGDEKVEAHLAVREDGIFRDYVATGEAAKAAMTRLNDEFEAQWNIPERNKVTVLEPTSLLGKALLKWASKL